MWIKRGKTLLLIVAAIALLGALVYLLRRDARHRALRQRRATRRQLRHSSS
jgi:hypothetical protein